MMSRKRKSETRLPLSTNFKRKYYGIEGERIQKNCQKIFIVLSQKISAIAYTPSSSPKLSLPHAKHVSLLTYISLSGKYKQPFSILRCRFKGGITYYANLVDPSISKGVTSGHERTRRISLRQHEKWTGGSSRNPLFAIDTNEMLFRSF